MHALIRTLALLIFLAILWGFLYAFASWSERKRTLKPTNGDLLKRDRELRDILIAASSKSAAQKIIALKKPTADDIATIIANEIKNSAI